MLTERGMPGRPYTDVSIVTSSSFRAAQRAAEIEPLKNTVEVTSLLPDDRWRRLDIHERREAAETYADYARRSLGAEALAREVYVASAMRQIGDGMEIARVTVVDGMIPGRQAVDLLWNMAVALQVEGLRSDQQ